ncbi:aminotransferase [Catellatospora sp. TT07R-123]|uniref:pyridoxal phosphate-dependent aminotransferase n=1 Tax=Catellatospora sp. TT07R-123 TaxID=2733863 RepID=UPI001B2F3FAC|nr:aminotransferase class I/II-fold pyridoxal phosphate-dependent enzyme [Catellatospora sp. TT07R-123]GHJ43100.1 aminotransferase [Catellatospora sp. TT07R-123]
MTAPLISAEVAATPASGIRALANAAWRHPGAIHLELGEPDFATPGHIVEAGHAAARDGRTRYSPSVGVPALRDAVVDKLARDNGLTAAADHVVVTAGGVGGLTAAYRALLSAGDEILVPDPGWTNFSTIATMLGATARGYRLVEHDGFSPDYEHLDTLVGPRTRAILINSPANPVGYQWNAAQLAELGQWADRHGLTVISDECYDQLWLDEPAVTFAAAAPDTPAVTVFSLSKSYAMTGWRLGYAVTSGPGHDRLAAALARVLEATASCVSTPTQYAGTAALAGPQDCVADMRQAYRSRRDTAVDRAAALGLSAVRPAGAFYLWLAVPSVADTAAFALDLLAERGVALAPGVAFGSQGRSRLRLSLAARPEEIDAGLTGLAGFLNIRPTTPQ